MAKWMVRAKRADFKALAEKYDIDQVIAQILVNRDIPEEEFAQFLHPSIDSMNDPGLLKDGKKAAQRIKKAIDDKESIRVIGDYDIDGICSTYILVSAIRLCGGRVSYAIPHRITDGYGLNERLIRQAGEDGVSLIVTCDNGIAAYDETVLANELGMSVVVTDHHEIPYLEENGIKKYIIPPAEAVVNPHQADCEYPFKDICGAVVAWRVVMLLYELCGRTRKEAADDYIDPAAFATIGDIMPLINENRAIVKEGLRRLGHTQNPGMNALIERSNIDRDNITTYHVGYILGPCFNASGRLDTATLAVNMLLQEDAAEAVRQAAELVALNAERKQMTEKSTTLAMQMIEEEGLYNDPVLMLYIPSLHESLCGIVAGRIKEKYYRPTFVLCDGEECVKGSGRSIPGYSMYERMNECAGLFIKFGGHPMAAGLSIKKENIPELRERLIRNCGLNEDDLLRKIMIDVPMPIDYINLRLLEQIETMEPYGVGNERPLFADRELMVCSLTEIGADKKYRKLNLRSDKGSSITALYFGEGESLDKSITDRYGREALEEARQGKPNPIRLNIVYETQINSFRGTRTPQILIREYEVK